MHQLFEETAIGGLALKNRLIRAATHEGCACEDEESRTRLLEIYRKIAAGGAGAIITGYVGVQPDGRTFPNMRMFDSDQECEYHLGMNDALKELGTPLILQIAHGGGQCHGEVIGKTPAAPTGMRYNQPPHQVRALQDEEIIAIIDSFVAAIVRAKEVGYAGVEVHAAHGYLLSEFLSPNLNRRQDQWGGSTAKRYRIIAEIIDRARDRVGVYPILIKINAFDSQRHGMTLDESRRIAELVQQSGFEALEVSSGNVSDGFDTIRVAKVPVEALIELVDWVREMPQINKTFMRLLAPVIFRPAGALHNYNVSAAAAIKKTVDLPVIVVGGIRKLADMERIVAGHMADFISLCRPFIIEPDIVNKFRTGSQTESRCLDCGLCVLCVDKHPLRCYHGKIPKHVH